MMTAHCDSLDLVEAWTDADRSQKGRFDVPLSAETGAADSAVIYFEVDPGHHAGRHTHSCEEVLYIRAGTADVEVAGERSRATPGTLAVVPAFALHDVYNVGDDVVQVVGFFSASALVTKLDRAIQPMGTDVLVMGAPRP